MQPAGSQNLPYGSDQLHTHGYPAQPHPQQLNMPYSQYAPSTNQAAAETPAGPVASAAPVAPLVAPNPLQPPISEIPGHISGAIHPGVHQGGPLPPLAADPSVAAAAFPPVASLRYSAEKQPPIHQQIEPPVPGNSNNNHQYSSALDGLAQAALFNSSEPAQQTQVLSHPSPQVALPEQMEHSVEMSRYDTPADPRLDDTSSELEPEDEISQVDDEDMRQQSREVERVLITKISRGVDLFNESNKALQTLERITLENQRLLTLLESYSEGLPPLAAPAARQKTTPEKREMYEVLLSDLVQH